MLWGLQELRTLIQDIINELNKNEIDLGRFGDFSAKLTECPIWKEHYFEAVYRAEFSTHFVGTYRKLKPKDVQIDW